MKDLHCRHRIRITVVLVGLLIFVSGCAQEVEFDQVYTIVNQATLHPGDIIPPPESEPILTISGKIGANKLANTLQMDRATIERAGVVEYRVKDPFSGESVRYRGVLMRDLLELWQVDEDAQQVYLVALNDYAIEVPLSEFYQYPVLFALQADGVYMEPDTQGPAMLVYPLDQYAFDLTKVKRNWIWQIKSIELQ